MAVQEVIGNLITAVSEWFEKAFNVDSGIMKAIEDIIRLIVSSYVDA